MAATSQLSGRWAGKKGREGEVNLFLTMCNRDVRRRSLQPTREEEKQNKEVAHISGRSKKVGPASCVRTERKGLKGSGSPPFVVDHERRRFLRTNQKRKMKRNPSIKTFGAWRGKKQTLQRTGLQGKRGPAKEETKEKKSRGSFPKAVSESMKGEGNPIVGGGCGIEGRKELGKKSKKKDSFSGRGKN